MQTIFFDHDGTLVDSETAHYEMWRDILNSYSKTLSIEGYTAHYAGIPSVQNAKDIVNKYDLSVSWQSLLEQKDQLTRDYLANGAFPLMPGAREALGFFHSAGVNLGIVTGAGRAGVEATIESYQFGDMISVVVSGDDVAQSKPAPDCYLLAAKQLAVKPADCWAIEDTVSGMTSAVSAKMRCVGVSRSSATRRLLDRADYVCTNLLEATRWLSCNTKLAKTG